MNKPQSFAPTPTTGDLFDDAHSSPPSAQTPIEGFFGIYRFLSNFWYAKVELDGVVYPTIENAYQAAKTEPHLRSPFRDCTPGQAKSAGRGVPIRKTWDQEKVDVMRGMIEQKFALGTELADKLLVTGDCRLVESNTWGDVFWGECGGRGQNNLGKLLMAQRDLLKIQSMPKKDRLTP
jgi:ribA/ribD-fused uncharacterized protein